MKYCSLKNTNAGEAVQFEFENSLETIEQKDNLLFEKQGNVGGVPEDLLLDQQDEK
jgi:hypothetical protein